ncbi:hypothetical protein [Nitrincola alkalilacustris]|uniref:hypothetical protein n=1 Tax=Nitrincola alkalilacustris TaxID=1571224 RepID=UPI00124EC171|nr:hypothetical protein [Nitrincola alkalilacustris]
MNDNEEIGGYFGLWLPDEKPIHDQAVAFNSARSAIRAVLHACDKRVIYIPSYVCDSVIKAARDAGCEVRLYAINNNFMPIDIPVNIAADFLILYVNYFGLCDSQVDEILKIYPADQVVIDNSHALYSSVTDALATIYSPRKFVGLPDGGLAYVRSCVELENFYPEDEDSISRMDYLLLRYGYSARDGYTAFNIARESLSDNTPKAMSTLTKRLMRSIPWQEVKECRQKNYFAMKGFFSDINLIQFKDDNYVAPLCYPLRVSEHSLSCVKKILSEKNIFAPTYWPDVISRAGKGSIEYQLVKQTLFLPIDQRLTQRHLDIVCQIVVDALALNV